MYNVPLAIRVKLDFDLIFTSMNGRKPLLFCSCWIDIKGLIFHETGRCDKKNKRDDFNKEGFKTKNEVTYC